MSSDVQTMADLEDSLQVRALQTPLYLIISAFGALMFVSSFLTWATVSVPTALRGELADDAVVESSVSGLDAGGWGLGAMIVGVIIFVLGVLGYIWNPFSDPEASLIAGFSLAAVVASLVKMLDVESLFTEGSPLFDYFELESAAGAGLWLVLTTGALSLLSALWILYSRPRAEARLDA